MNTTKRKIGTSGDISQQSLTDFPEKMFPIKAKKNKENCSGQERILPIEGYHCFWLPSIFGIFY